MKITELVSKLRIMLADDKKLVKVNEKMAEATLVDGTEVYTEGELQAGAILFVRAGEGVSEDPFAPAGIHETTDGSIITVGENGEITSVEQKADDVTLAEEVVVEELPVEDVVVDEEFNMEELLIAIAELLKPYMKAMDTVQEDIVTLESRFSKIADEPAAKKIGKQTFAQNRDLAMSTAEGRLERLIQIRKDGFKRN